MNTTGIKEEITNKYDFSQNYVKLSGVESGGSVVPDADAAEGVELELSEAGMQKLAEEQKNSNNQKYSQSQMKMFQEEMERMRESNEKAAEHTNDMSKIMTIFRRIFPAVAFQNNSIRTGRAVLQGQTDLQFSVSASSTRPQDQPGMSWSLVPPVRNGTVPDSESRQ